MIDMLPSNTAPPQGDTHTHADLAGLLAELERSHFYGNLDVKFEAGRVVLLKKTETIKPNTSRCRNNRGETWPNRHT
jgi:hypothetical protein